MDDLAISKNSIHPEQTEIIMYQTEDGLTKIDVHSPSYFPLLILKLSHVGSFFMFTPFNVIIFSSLSKISAKFKEPNFSNSILIFAVSSPNKTTSLSFTFLNDLPVQK